MFYHIGIDMHKDMHKEFSDKKYPISVYRINVQKPRKNPNFSTF